MTTRWGILVHDGIKSVREGRRERQSVGWKGPSAHGLQQYVKCVFLFLGLAVANVCLCHT